MPPVKMIGNWPAVGFHWDGAEVTSPRNVARDKPVEEGAAAKSGYALAGAHGRSAVPPEIHDCNHWLEEPVRSSRLDGARVVQNLAELSWDRKLDCPNIIFHLCELGGPDNRRGDARLGSRPIQRDLRRSFPQLFRHIQVRR